MKKILILLIPLLLIGCSLSNSPSSKVEAFLNNYNNLSDDVLLDIEKSALNENLSEDNKNMYKNVLSRQYENMKYEIKDESVDANSAIVTVKVTVYDLYKVEKESLNYMNENSSEFYDTDGVFSNDMFNTYRINKLYDANETIDYEIKFYLDKKNNEWILRNPDKETLEKLNGFYNYSED